jgi:hypothetical protein
MLSSNSRLPTAEDQAHAPCAKFVPHETDDETWFEDEAYTVKCAWDAEARVWYVQETNVPGLATESATVEAMTRKRFRARPQENAACSGCSARRTPARRGLTEVPERLMAEWRGAVEER